jgi:phage anti-repressor protein
MSTNTALIPVTEGTIQGRAQQICNARDLHAFLEVRRDFTNWIKQRIAKYGFVEGEGYEVYANFCEKTQGRDVCSPNLASKGRSGDVCSPDLGSKEGQGRGGHNATEYRLTLDMAKQLSMVENNERGRQARRYFIECERLSYEACAKEAPGSEERAFFSKVRRITVDGAARVHCVMPDNHVRTFGWWDYSESHCIITGELDALYEIREGKIPLPLEYDDLGYSFRIRPPARCGVLFAGNQTGEPMRQDLFLLPPAKVLLVGNGDEIEEMPDAAGLQFSRVVMAKQPRGGMNEDRY